MPDVKVWRVCFPLDNPEAVTGQNECNNINEKGFRGLDKAGFQTKDTEQQYKAHLNVTKPLFCYIENKSKR